MKSREYRLVKQIFYKGDYKTEVLLHATSFDFAFKELVKFVREHKTELLEYDSTVGILNDMGFLCMYFQSRRLE